MKGNTEEEYVEKRIHNEKRLKKVSLGKEEKETVNNEIGMNDSSPDSSSGPGRHKQVVAEIRGDGDLDEPGRTSEGDENEKGKNEMKKFHHSFRFII